MANNKERLDLVEQRLEHGIDDFAKQLQELKESMPKSLGSNAWGM